MQKAMSALPPIATAKADFRTRSCPLYPQKRTSLALFDHLIGTSEQRRQHSETERLMGFPKVLHPAMYADVPL